MPLAPICIVNPPRKAAMHHHAHNAREIPVIALTAADLGPHGTVACPSPRSGMPAWASHPHVYLHLDTDGRAQCPYCGNIYQLVPFHTK